METLKVLIVFVCFLSIRELSFRKGDIINVRRQVDKNWIDGELNGRRGIFPQNYVEVDNFYLFLAKAKTRFKGVFLPHNMTHSSRDFIIHFLRYLCSRDLIE